MRSLVVALGLALICVVQADAQSYSRYSRGGYQSSRTSVDVRLNSEGGSYSTRVYSNTYGPTSRRIYPSRYIGPAYQGPVYSYPQLEGISLFDEDSSITMGTEYVVPVRPVIPARPYRYRYR